MKNSVFGHKKLRQISLAKNQPLQPGLPFPGIHFGPSCKIAAIVYFFFFWPLKRELFPRLSSARYLLMPLMYNLWIKEALSISHQTLKILPSSHRVKFIGDQSVYMNEWIHESSQLHHFSWQLEQHSLQKNLMEKGLANPNWLVTTRIAPSFP